MIIYITHENYTELYSGCVELSASWTLELLNTLSFNDFVLLLILYSLSRLPFAHLDELLLILQNQAEIVCTLWNLPDSQAE